MATQISTPKIHKCQSLFNPTLNPLTLRVSRYGIVCYFHTFEDNFRMKQKFTKYLKESCCLASDQHLSFKCFQVKAFVSKIFQNHQAFLAALSVDRLIHPSAKISCLCIFKIKIQPRIIVNVRRFGFKIDFVLTFSANGGSTRKFSAVGLFRNTQLLHRPK